MRLDHPNYLLILQLIPSRDNPMFSPTDGQREATHYVRLLLATRIRDIRTALNNTLIEIAARSTPRSVRYEYTEHDIRALRDVPLREWKP
jgi:hypothetical protein